MVRSGTISVVKRDGTVEPFDLCKLRGCLLRILPDGRGDLYLAGALAEGIECYLRRRGLRCLSSAAVLEMVLTVLGGMGLTAAAEGLERHRAARLALRHRLTVSHHGRMRTAWSKGWLVRRTRSQWGLGRAAARIVAGEVEQSLVRRGARDVGRSDVMAMLEARLAAYGFAAKQAGLATAPEG